MTAKTTESSASQSNNGSARSAASRSRRVERKKADALKIIEGIKAKAYEAAEKAAGDMKGDSQKLAQGIAESLSAVEAFLVLTAERIARAAQASLPFVKEIEKDLFQMLGEHISLNDPRLTDDVLDQAMAQAIRRIYDDKNMDVDSVSLADVLKRIEENKAALVSLLRTASTNVDEVLHPLADLFERAFAGELTDSPQTETVSTFKPKQQPTIKGKRKRKQLEPASVDYTYQLIDADYVSYDRETKTIAMLNDDGSVAFKFSSKFSPFDQRVYEIISAIWYSGRDYTTSSEIQLLMNGNNNRATVKQTQRIDDCVSRWMVTLSSIDTSNEQHLERKSKSWRGALLPCETVDGIVQGRETKVIHLLGEPPLSRFCRQRKQVAPHNIKVLQSPLDLRDDSIRLENALLTRISHMRHDKTQPRVILLDWLYEKCRAAESSKPSRKRQQIRQNAETYLEHLKTCGTITGYEFDLKTKRIQIEIN